MAQTVSQYYIEGIGEGIAMWKAWKAQGMDDAELPALAKAHLDNIKRTARTFDAQSPVGQMLRGERDFWRNKLKKA
jgi:hypothetical protein